MTSFPDAVQSVLDRPFSRGGVCGEDCISLLYRIYPPCGVPLPESFAGWSRADYAARYDAGENVGDVLLDFLTSLGRPVDEAHMVDGDLLIIQMLGARLPVLPAIYLGGGHLLVADEKYGVYVLPLRVLAARIIGVRRLFGGAHGR